MKKRPSIWGEEGLTETPFAFVIEPQVTEIKTMDNDGVHLIYKNSFFVIEILKSLFRFQFEYW